MVGSDGYSVFDVLCLWYLVKLTRVFTSVAKVIKEMRDKIVGQPWVYVVRGTPVPVVSTAGYKDDKLWDQADDWLMTRKKEFYDGSQ